MQRVKEEHKASLKEKFQFVFERNTDYETPLERIYTKLYITGGESQGVNDEHEVWQIEKRSWGKKATDTPINCNDLFKPLPGTPTHQNCNDQRHRWNRKNGLGA